MLTKLKYSKEWERCTPAGCRCTVNDHIMGRGAINVKEIYWEVAKKSLIGTELTPPPFTIFIDTKGENSSPR